MAIVSYGRALSLHAEQQPDAVAIAHEGRSVSRSELEASSRRMARCFAEHGVGVGDFVTIALPNGIRFLEATFAAWKLGAVPQPVSSRLPQAERNAILDRAQPSLVFGVAEGTHADFTCLPEDHDTSDYDDAPLLIVNATQLDFVHKQEDLDALLDFLTTPVRGTMYFSK